MHLLNHGFDEKNSENKLDLNDLKKAARFGGEEYLQEWLVDMKTKVIWKCAFRHRFEGSSTLLLEGSH